MKEKYVMFRMFSVNDRIVMANDIEEAISLYKQTLNAEEIKSAYVCRDGEFCFVKIATEEDYIATHGKKD